MNLSRCERGHFFDKEKYATCPHCAKGVMTDDSLTTVFTEELSDDVTEPLNTNPVVQENIIPQVTVPPVIEPLSSITPPPGLQQVQSLSQEFTGGQLNDMEDDDHTVAFYDDIFSPQDSNPVSNVTTGISQAQGTPRVTTPCVGWLVVTKGMHLGQDYHLKTGKNFIGRDSQMDIVLDGDKSVSRNKHAIIVYEPKQHLYLVQPGESSELVYLNDNVVLSPVQLKMYDVITVGEVNLLFIPLCGKEFNWTDELKKRM